MIAKIHDISEGRDPGDGDDVFLEAEQLADRWRCDPKTVIKRWRGWGLKGTRFGKRLIFPLWSIKEVEKRRLQKSK